MTYAKDTSVNVDRTRSEIERLVVKHGAKQFLTGWNDANQAVVGFVLEGRQVRFVLSFPGLDAPHIAYTPAKRQRTSAQAQTALDQEVRALWRALLIIIKAKLVAVESGVVTFEEEFLAHIVLPDGRTVADHSLPVIAESYRVGAVQPLLQIGS